MINKIEENRSRFEPVKNSNAVPIAARITEIMNLIFFLESQSAIAPIIGDKIPASNTEMLTFNPHQNSPLFPAITSLKNIGNTKANIRKEYDEFAKS